MKDDPEGGPREQSQDSIPAAGSQAGGGPESVDMAAPGGSSGAGGYGQGQNQQFHQGQDQEFEASDASSRQDRFDEAQGGGRAADSVSPDDLNIKTGQDDRDAGGEADADD